MKPLPTYDLSALKQEILELSGYKAVGVSHPIKGWGSLNKAFPNHCLPQAAIHEFQYGSSPSAAASAAFVAATSAQLQRKGPLLWITSSRSVHPPALYFFGWRTQDVIFMILPDGKKRMAALDEALRCDALHAVIAEVGSYNITQARRLQLAVEQSGVTGFLLQHESVKTQSLALARWQIHPLSSENGQMPGVGDVRWQVKLLRIRNGIPGTWQLGWKGGRFISTPAHLTTLPSLQKKVG